MELKFNIKNIKSNIAIHLCITILLFYLKEQVHATLRNDHLHKILFD